MLLKTIPYIMLAQAAHLNWCLLVYAFVFVPYESSTSHLCRLLCITALILLLVVVVIDPGKGSELCNSNLKALQ